MLHEREKELVRAFCEYEINQFPEYMRIPVEDYVKRIEKLSTSFPCSFLRLESITNGGCTNATLSVTPKGDSYNYSKGDYVIYLPPRPHNKFKGEYTKVLRNV